MIVHDKRRSGPRSLALTLALAAAAFGATGASAQLLNFSFDNGLFFQLDSNPTPAIAFEPGNSANVPPQFTVTSSAGFEGFFDPATFPDGNGGGFDFNDYQDPNGLYSGAKLYSGTESVPTLLTGEYDLVKQFDGSAVHLSVTAAAPGAPGPELGGGILSALAAGLALLMARSRKAKPAVAIA